VVAERDEMIGMAGPRARVQESVATGAGGRLLAAAITLSAVCCLAVTIIWAVLGAGRFWPMWVWQGVGVPLVLVVWLARAWTEPAGAPRRRAVHTALATVLSVTVFLTWLMAGAGFFWPVFPIIVLLGSLAVHIALDSPRQTDLSARVEELTRTRRGVLDVQAAQLRRIERDLHDGAQSRLVALSLALGRAEERLEDRPDAAALVRQAREEATAAVAELRDLARGIAPPVLADRGLVAAVQGLAVRSGAEVSVQADVGVRPPPVVETAAYFVTAEALTNAVKHAPGAAITVTVTGGESALVVAVADDGPGGADPAGSGITGLRQRVEALDGRLEIRSPAGVGTTITAVLPCE
jgi:signal transduction histidine kinase